jgi:hypothetical protein
VEWWVFVVAFIGCLAAFLVVALGMGRVLERQGFRRGQAPPAIRAPHRFGEGAYEGRCGVRVQSWNATHPLVTVTVDSEWLHLVGIPTYDVWIERARVTGVRTVRLFGRGLIFDSQDGAYDGVIIWLLHHERLAALRLLAALGWPVQPVEASLPRT